MMRITIFFGLFIMLLATSGPALSQGIPACYPGPLPAFSQCGPSRPAPPISRTVQVDVPVPCPPVSCGPPMPRPPYPCAPPVCAPPPCPTRPVQVRVDVVVRPEPCGQARLDGKECLDPGPLGPVLCGLAQILVAPIRALERCLPGPGRCPQQDPWCSSGPVCPPQGGPQLPPAGSGPFAQPVAWSPAPMAPVAGRAPFQHSSAVCLPGQKVCQPAWMERGAR
jgi:hypothetical protein